MYLEIAQLPIRAGSEQAFEEAAARGVEVFLRARGCSRMELRRCVERPNVYLLLVWWDTLEDHMEHFRNSPQGLRAWRELVSEFYDGTPSMEHSLRVPVWFSRHDAPTP